MTRFLNACFYFKIYALQLRLRDTWWRFSTRDVVDVEITGSKCSNVVRVRVRQMDFPAQR